jgi:quinol monooxygenase YgiN
MVLAKARIGDFDQFWSTFTTRGAEKRSEHGSRGAQVFRNRDDESEILVLFDWDPDGYKAFLSDPEVPEIFAAAGLAGPPEGTYLEPVGEHAS